MLRRARSSSQLSALVTLRQSCALSSSLVVIPITRFEAMSRAFSYIYPGLHVLAAPVPLAFLLLLLSSASEYAILSAIATADRGAPATVAFPRIGFVLDARPSRISAESSRFPERHFAIVR